MRLKEINVDQRWTRLSDDLKIGKPKPRVSNLKWISVAAAILIVVVLTVYIGSWKLQRNEVIAAAVIPKDKVLLTLSDGTLIGMDTLNGRFQVNENLLKSKELEGQHMADSNVMQWAKLSVPAGKDYRVVLNDGTEIWLNAASSLKFPYVFSGAAREVYLEGEAYFNVTKDEQHPFIVHSGGADVRVLGTQFNMNAYTPEKITTALVEGKVLMSYKETTIQLNPGYKATLQNGDLVQSTFDASETLSWMQGVVYFRETPLEDIASLLTRFYGVQVIFDNPSLKHERFSGSVSKSDPIKVFLKNIEIASGVQVTQNNDQLHFR